MKTKKKKEEGHAKGFQTCSHQGEYVDGHSHAA
jgi:hypothetical protein